MAPDAGFLVGYKPLPAPKNPYKTTRLAAANNMLSAKQMNAIFGTPAPVPAMSEARQKERELQIEGIDARQDSTAGTDLSLAADERALLVEANEIEAELQRTMMPATADQQETIDSAAELQERMRGQIRETEQRGGITAGEASQLRTEMNSLASSARSLADGRFAGLTAVEQTAKLNEIRQDAVDAAALLAGPATPQTTLLLNALNRVGVGVQAVGADTTRLPQLLRDIQAAGEATRDALDPTVVGSFADLSLNPANLGTATPADPAVTGAAIAAVPAPAPGATNADARRADMLRGLNPVTAAAQGVTGPMIALLNGPANRIKAGVQAMIAADPAAVHGFKYILATNSQRTNDNPKILTSRAPLTAVWDEIGDPHRVDLQRNTGRTARDLSGRGLVSSDDTSDASDVAVEEPRNYKALTTVSSSEKAAQLKAELASLLEAGEQTAAVDFVIEHHEEFGSANANRLLKTLYSR